MYKRFLALLLSLVMLSGMLPVMASAASGTYSGCDWTFSSGTLTLSVTDGGDGRISCGYEYSTPWWKEKFADDIRTIVVEEGIVSLGDSLFQTCENVEALYLPLSLSHLGNFLFWEFDTEGMQVYYTGTPSDWSAVSTGVGDDWLDAVTLHCYYNYPVSVTLDPQGGTVANPGKTVIYEKTYGSLPAPTRPGYTFDGWYTGANGGTKVTASTKVSVSNPHTLYARWIGNSYTVSFDAGSCAQKVEDIKVTAGGTYSSLPVLTQANQTFLGWYTEPAGGQRITQDTLVEISSDCTLYARWSSGTMDNFYPAEAYTNQFADVSQSDWYYQGVSQAFSYGLITGTSETSFAPKGNITLGQAVTIAARLHKTYFTGSAAFAQGSPWYQVYVDYAKENGILDKDYANYDKAATRGEFAAIFSAALPKNELPGINTIEEMAIPDVDPDASYGDALYTLYRAGILTGSDAKGTYRPASNISRCEAAALLTRMANPDLRVKKDLSVSYTYVYDAQGSRYRVAECLVPRYLAQGYLGSRDAASVRMTRSHAVIYIGETLGLSVLTIPVDANTVTWSTSNGKIASVDSAGRVVGKAAGTVTITATTPKGLKTSATVEVIRKPSIIIQGAIVSGINSVDGVNMSIAWRNNSGKTINYVNFYVQVLDLNGSVLYNQVGGGSTFHCYVRGPIAPADPAKMNVYGWRDGDLVQVLPSNTLPGEYFYKRYGDFPFEKGMIPPENAKFACQTSSWDAIMYNGRAASIRISSVVLEYADGTKETIYRPRVGYNSVSSDAVYHETYLDALKKSEDNQAETEATIDALNGIIWEDDDATHSYNYMRIVKTSANTVRIDEASLFVEDIGQVQRQSGTCYMDPEGRLVIPSQDGSTLLFHLKLEGNKLEGYFGGTLFEGLSAYRFTRYR